MRRTRWKTDVRTLNTTAPSVIITEPPAAAAAARGEGDRGDVDVRATEVLSMGMEWMWLDPVGFRRRRPGLLRLRLGYSGAGYSLIRLRDKATGAEAEWDREQWSGDADFIQQLRVMMRIEHVRSFSHDTFGAIQSRMAERFPSYGIVVVHTTTPEEIPHDPDVVY